MLFHLLLVIAPTSFIFAFPQNEQNGIPATTNMSQADGFVFDGPAMRPSSWPFNNSGQRTTSSTTPVTSTNSPATSLSDDQLNNQFNTCVDSCPVTPEYNPVCGTDGVDYTNPGNLGCAQRCGKEVTLNYYGRCSTGRTG